MPTKKMIEKLTDAQTADIAVTKIHWIARAIRTAEAWRPDEAAALVPLIYKDSGNKPPKIVRCVVSPGAALDLIAEIEGGARTARAASDGAGYCAWRAFYDYFNRHFGLAPKIANYVKFDECSPFLWWFFKEAAIVSGPPLFFRFDQGRPDGSQAYRLHCSDGPAMKWSDGYELHYWHGVPVPKKWIMSPELIGVAEVLAQQNTEKRRVMYEIVGYDRMLTELGAEMVQRDDFGDLLVSTALRDDGDKPATFVRVKCPSTGRVYVNRVNPDCKTARAACASRWRLKESEYSPALES